MKKVISGAVVIALLFAIMIPARYFGAFAEASQTLFINEVMSSNVSQFGTEMLQTLNMEVRAEHIRTGLKSIMPALMMWI